MTSKEVDEVKLVLENGEEFQFLVDTLFAANEKKRDKKNKGKKERTNGIDVTDLVSPHKDKKGRWMTVALSGYDSCKFTSRDNAGRVYKCPHCAK